METQKAKSVLQHYATDKTPLRGYVPFHQRIKQIDVNVIRQVNISDQKQKSTSSKTATQDSKQNYLLNFSFLPQEEKMNSVAKEKSKFAEALEWNQQFNRTHHYGHFVYQVKSLCQTLPELLYNKETIVQKLLLVLKNATENLASISVIQLIPVLARELRAEFYPYLSSIFDHLIEILNATRPHHDKAVEKIEAIFHCIAFLFKYLFKNMINDITNWFEKYSTTLLNHRQDYIRQFASESFSFLILKLSDEKLITYVEKVFELLFEDEHENDELLFDGVSNLFYEIIKGPLGKFHSKALHIVEILLKQLQKEKNASRAEKKFVFLEKLFTTMAKYARDRDTLKPFYEAQCSTLQSIDSCPTILNYSLLVGIVSIFASYKEKTEENTTKQMVTQVFKNYTQISSKLSQEQSKLLESICVLLCHCLQAYKTVNSWLLPIVMKLLSNDYTNHFDLIIRFVSQSFSVLQTSSETTTATIQFIQNSITKSHINCDTVISFLYRNKSSSCWNALQDEIFNILSSIYKNVQLSTSTRSIALLLLEECNISERMTSKKNELKAFFIKELKSNKTSFKLRCELIKLFAIKYPSDADTNTIIPILLSILKEYPSESLVLETIHFLMQQSEFETIVSSLQHESYISTFIEVLADKNAFSRLYSLRILEILLQKEKAIGFIKNLEVAEGCKIEWEKTRNKNYQIQQIVDALSDSKKIESGYVSDLMFKLLSHYCCGALFTKFAAYWPVIQNLMKMLMTLKLNIFWPIFFVHLKNYHSQFLEAYEEKQKEQMLVVDEKGEKRAEEAKKLLHFSRINEVLKLKPLDEISVIDEELAEELYMSSHTDFYTYYQQLQEAFEKNLLEELKIIKSTERNQSPAFKQTLVENSLEYLQFIYESESKYVTGHCAHVLKHIKETPFKKSIAIACSFAYTCLSILKVDALTLPPKEIEGTLKKLLRSTNEVIQKECLFILFKLGDFYKEMVKYKWLEECWNSIRDIEPVFIQQRITTKEQKLLIISAYLPKLVVSPFEEKRFGGLAERSRIKADKRWRDSVKQLFGVLLHFEPQFIEKELFSEVFEDFKAIRSQIEQDDNVVRSTDYFDAVNRSVVIISVLSSIFKSDEAMAKKFEKVFMTILEDILAPILKDTIKFDVPQKRIKDQRQEKTEDEESEEEDSVDDENQTEEKDDSDEEMQDAIEDNDEEMQDALENQNLLETDNPEISAYNPVEEEDEETEESASKGRLTRGYYLRHIQHQAVAIVYDLFNFCTFFNFSQKYLQSLTNLFYATINGITPHEKAYFPHFVFYFESWINTTIQPLTVNLQVLSAPSIEFLLQKFEQGLCVATGAFERFLKWLQEASTCKNQIGVSFLKPLAIPFVVHFSKMQQEHETITQKFENMMKRIVDSVIDYFDSPKNCPVDTILSFYYTSITSLSQKNSSLRSLLHVNVMKLLERMISHGSKEMQLQFVQLLSYKVFVNAKIVDTNAEDDSLVVSAMKLISKITAIPNMNQISENLYHISKYSEDILKYREETFQLIDQTITMDYQLLPLASGLVNVLNLYLETISVKEQAVEQARFKNTHLNRNKSFYIAGDFACQALSKMIRVIKLHQQEFVISMEFLSEHVLESASHDASMTSSNPSITLVQSMIVEWENLNPFKPNPQMNSLLEPFFKPLATNSFKQKATALDYLNSTLLKDHYEGKSLQVFSQFLIPLVIKLTTISDPQYIRTKALESIVSIARVVPLRVLKNDILNELVTVLQHAEVEEDQKSIIQILNAIVGRDGDQNSSILSQKYENNPRQYLQYCVKVVVSKLFRLISSKVGSKFEQHLSLLNAYKVIVNIVQFYPMKEEEEENGEEEYVREIIDDKELARFSVSKHAVMEKNVKRIVLQLIPGLKFKHTSEVRELCRSILTELMEQLGDKFFEMIIQLLSITLVKGFEVPILDMTICHILKHTSTKLFHLSNRVIDLLFTILLRDIKKNELDQRFLTKEQYQTKDFEAVYDSFISLGRMIPGASQLQHIMDALNKQLEQLYNVDILQRFENLFANLLKGLLENTLIQTTTLLEWSTEALRDIALYRTNFQVETEVYGSKYEQKKRGKVTQEETFTVLPEPPRMGYLDADDPRSKRLAQEEMHNEFIGAVFCLKVMKHVLQTKSEEMKNRHCYEILDGMIPLWIKYVKEKNLQVAILSLECLHISHEFAHTQCNEEQVKQVFPLLSSRMQQAVDAMFELMLNTGMDNSQTWKAIFGAFKSFASTNVVQFTENQLDMLLDLIKLELSNQNSEASFEPFALTKLLVSKRVMAPQIYDILLRIRTKMIKTTNATIRTYCIDSLADFYIYYPMAENVLQDHLNFLVKNIMNEYLAEESKLGILEMIETIVNRFPQPFIDKKVELFVCPMLIELVNENSHKIDIDGLNSIRKRLHSILVQVLKKSSVKSYDQVLKLAQTWLEKKDSKLEMTTANLLCVAIELTKKFKPHLQTFLPFALHFIEECSNMKEPEDYEQEEEAASEYIFKSKLLFHYLVFLKRAVETSLLSLETAQMKKLMQHTLHKLFENSSIQVRVATLRIYALYLNRSMQSLNESVALIICKAIAVNINSVFLNDSLSDLATAVGIKVLNWLLKQNVDRTKLVELFEHLHKQSLVFLKAEELMVEETTANTWLCLEKMTFLKIFIATVAENTDKFDEELLKHIIPVFAVVLTRVKKSAKKLPPNSNSKMRQVLEKKQQLVQFAEEAMDIFKQNFDKVMINRIFSHAEDNAEEGADKKKQIETVQNAVKNPLQYQQEKNREAKEKKLKKQLKRKQELQDGVVPKKKKKV